MSDIRGINQNDRKIKAVNMEMKSEYGLVVALVQSQLLLQKHMSCNNTR